MQQVAPRLSVADATEGNKMLKEAKDLNAVIRFNKLQGTVNKVEVWTFSDASYNIVSGRDCGLTGIVTGRMAWSDNGEQAFNVMDWASTKQRRVSHFFIRC